MFRVLSVVAHRRVYPARKVRKVLLPVTAALVLLALSAGCGGGGGGTTTAAGSARTVTGDGYSFEVPNGWTLKVQPTGAAATRDPSTIVSVTVLPLVRPYRIALFPRVVVELDRVASELAAKLGGKVTSRATVRVGGRQARQYGIAHGVLVDRITFVLRGKENFQLTCRWKAADGEPTACAQLVSSFAFRRPAGS
jgi:hypothetical protein